MNRDSRIGDEAGLAADRLAVMISSTSLDLPLHRDTVNEAIRRVGWYPLAMEHGSAEHGSNALSFSLRMVDQANLFIGVIAFRYGYVPDDPQTNPNGWSVTEHEYRRAVGRGIPVLIFFMDEDHPDARKDAELSGTAQRKLEALKAELKTKHIIGFFRSVDQLQARVLQSLYELKPSLLNTAGRRGRESDGLPGTSAVPVGNWLPAVEGERLFGREQELRRLDQAWEDSYTRVLSIVAWGGVGKSALLAHWLRQMAERNHAGAERVFVWSFYSQGTRETVASAISFLDAALRAFGDPNPDAGTLEQKGERLAKLVRVRRTLLVLDGLEPLQYPPFAQDGGRSGRLKDAGLRTLLRQLAADNPGLCLITTRVPVVDLERLSAWAVQLDLERLAPEAGAALLRHLHVRGEPVDLLRASVEFGGHALALTLLGTYLRDVFIGDVRRRAEVVLLEQDAEQGGHALRVMAAYEKWFGNGPELAVLRLLGLFDRPASPAQVATLRAAPVIPGLTETLVDLGFKEWRRLLARLREARLLAPARLEELEVLDAHPLVREYFGSQLRQQAPEGWRLANDRLYELLRATTRELPDTMEEMLPLYVAIGHGCRAGRHQEVLEEVYWKRVRRGHQSYALTVLGGYGEDLGALAEFFEAPWSRPAAGLSDSAQANVLRWAAYRLGALGYVREAMAPFQAALQRYVVANPDHASVTASMLSQYALLLGQLEQARSYARAAQEHGERAAKVFRRLVGIAYLGRAHFVAGNSGEAEACFLTAEQLQRERQPRLPLLSSTPNFYYCEWLLSQGRYQEVQVRIGKLLEWRRCPELLALIPADEPTLGSPMNRALDLLCLGRSYVVALRQSYAYNEVAAVALNQAVDLLYEAREHSLVPFALLARAELRILLGQLNEAAADLAQAQEMALFGGMQLYLADCYLESARLHQARQQRDTSGPHRELARQELAAARGMYAAMGYRHRVADLASLAQLE
jgi:hypothetical protein